MNEDYVSLFILFFGLGFFLVSVRLSLRETTHESYQAERVSDKKYDRMLTEAREFGYEGSRLQQYINQQPKK